MGAEWLDRWEAERVARSDAAPGNGQDQHDDEHDDQHGDDVHRPVIPEEGAKHTKLLESLTKLGVQIENLRSTDEWQRMLETARKFHSYSLGNILLIWCQFPEATKVAGYRKWQELGRQVRKGERSIKILAPVTKKVELEDGTKGQRLIAFKPVSVFDISQTDGDPLPTVEWPRADECPEGLWDDLVVQVAAGNLAVIVGDEGDAVEAGMPAARGWYTRSAGTITVIDQGVEAANVAVLLHELGHHFDPQLESSGRVEKELVAESAAYLAAQQLGVGMEAETVHYLAHWEGSPAALLDVAHRSVKASQEIVRLATADLEGRELTDAVA